MNLKSYSKNTNCYNGNRHKSQNSIQISQPGFLVSLCSYTIMLTDDFLWRILKLRNLQPYSLFLVVWGHRPRHTCIDHCLVVMGGPVSVHFQIGPIVWSGELLRAEVWES